VSSRIFPKLEEIILKCLEKDPEDRYQTAKEIAVDLRRMKMPSSASQRVLPTPKRSVKTSRTFDSLAVLPLVNATGDPETEYLSDGISESILNLLSQLPNLRVIRVPPHFAIRGGKLI